MLLSRRRFGDDIDRQRRTAFQTHNLMGGDYYSALWRRPVASKRHSFHVRAAVFYPATAALQKSMLASTLKLLTTVRTQ